MKTFLETESKFHLAMIQEFVVPAGVRNHVIKAEWIGHKVILSKVSADAEMLRETQSALKRGITVERKEYASFPVKQKSIIRDLEYACEMIADKMKEH